MGAVCAFNGGPVDHELFSGDLGEAGHGALAELAAAEEDVDGAVGADLDVGVDGGGGGGAGGGGEAGEAGQAELQHEAAGGADEELTPLGSRACRGSACRARCWRSRGK